MPTARKHQLVHNVGDLAAGLMLHFGTEAAAIGLVLVEAFYSDAPWHSVNHIRDRRVGVSSDTVRRRLDYLTDRGLAEVRLVDQKRLYRASPASAEATIELIERCLTKQPAARAS